MTRGNPNKIKGQGFHTNPERINKKGRPTILPEIKELMLNTMGGHHAEDILNAIRARAKKGDIRAAEFLFDRCYGKNPEQISISESAIETIRIILPDGQTIEI